VLFHLTIGKRVVQVSVVQIVDMTIVHDGRVLAIGTVLVVVIGVDVAAHILLLRGKDGNQNHRGGIIRQFLRSLTRVIEGVADELGNVVVFKPIVDVLPFPSLRDDALAAQEFQPLRHSGQIVVGALGNFAYAQLTRSQQCEDAQAGAVAQRAEHFRSAIKSGRVERGSFTNRLMFAGIASGPKSIHGFLNHLMN
jgi:hypothetical protein